MNPMIDTLFFIVQLVAVQAIIDLKQFRSEVFTEDFNITLFNECTSTTREDVFFWTDLGGDLVLTPNQNSTNYDEDTWLNCIGDQEMDEIIAVSDGTYLQDYEPFPLAIGQTIFPWTGIRYFAVANCSCTN